MRIVVACECSRRVSMALEAKGHYVLSCDIKPAEVPGNHYAGSIFDIIDDGWDMMIGFPPCTHLAVSGAKHFPAKRADGRQQSAVDFFMALANADIPRIALENPVGIMSSEWRKPDQIIQPYYFGDEAQKTTCLWLKNLPLLKHYKEDDLFAKKTWVGKGEFYISPSGKKMPAWCSDPVGEDGKKLAYGSDEIKTLRSRLFPGIANAIGDQWGALKPLRRNQKACQ